MGPRSSCEDPPSPPAPHAPRSLPALPRRRRCVLHVRGSWRLHSRSADLRLRPPRDRGGQNPAAHARGPACRAHGRADHARIPACRARTRRACAARTRVHRRVRDGRWSAARTHLSSDCAGGFPSGFPSDCVVRAGAGSRRAQKAWRLCLVEGAPAHRPPQSLSRARRRPRARQYVLAVSGVEAQLRWPPPQRMRSRSR
eukprot:scaffold51671_cov26-Tisochrysis_lutea.AAC.8